ncbi:MAG: AAA family ATPase [Hydrogenophaga sp.]|uniref:AAA family ATPase n=1 Tax=Hydrogenophaga sp. TaxID=1904254 RepID=UPI002AB9B23A|nr:AAA family ATPase [Hydrogenophaga sp.]MDZ4283533.1 AAA family ATPase [Hydrogenophaga sp.]
MKKFIPPSKLHYDEDDADFAHREIMVYHPDEDAIRYVKLLLPVTLEIEQLVRQRSALAKQLSMTLDAEDLDKQAESKLAKNTEASRLSPLGGTRKKNDRWLVEDARADLKYKFVQDSEQLQKQDKGRRNQVQVYDWEEPLKLLTQQQSSPDEKLRERDTALFEQLKKRGAFRSTGNTFASDRALDGLRCLRGSQPHFGEVIDFIEGQVLMALELKTQQRIPPILVVGPPGIGKTHFTLDLARALERPVHRHSFDSSHTADSLSGGDRHWANSEPGLVFNAVCLTDRGDPLILLDEIDKATGYRTGNPLAPLHTLLEPLTACTVKDISLGLTFDASHASWVATANDPSLVPATIRSRFRVFNIKVPTAAQAIELAGNVAVYVHDRFKGFELPSRRVITALAPLTPREQVQALEHSFAVALLNGRKHLVIQDLPAEVMDLDGDDTPRPPRLH